MTQSETDISGQYGSGFSCFGMGEKGEIWNPKCPRNFGLSKSECLPLALLDSLDQKILCWERGCPVGGLAVSLVATLDANSPPW
jgi:hypothetical protein